nr:hypothetical protein [Tanacetum cinerariifolium]
MSSPKPSLKICVKKMKPSTTPIQPASDDIERDEIAEVTLLSLTMHKTALAAESQENVAKVQEKLLDEDIEKMVNDTEEESCARGFANSVFLNDDDDSGNVTIKGMLIPKEFLTDDIHATEDIRSMRRCLSW